MAAKKKSTAAKAGKAVKDAAKTVAKKADKYVVKPVSKALGLGAKKSAAKKTGTKSGAAKSKTAKKSTAKRGSGSKTSSRS